MSQGLQLSQRMSQQMVLSPQLQQSLALLQAPVLELKALVEQELQQNPLLEEVPATELTEEGRETRQEEAAQLADPAEPPPDVQFDPATEKPDAEPVDTFDEELQRLLQLDQEWRDHFSASALPQKSDPEEEERRQHLFDSLVAATSLQQELLDQVRTSDLPESLRPVAEMIIGNMDDSGYLRSGCQELSFSTSIPVEDVEIALKKVQTFHPAGVGARDLRECLMLQLERQERCRTLEYRILQDHFDALGKRRFPEIARSVGTTAAEVQKAAENIARLNPRPGHDYSSDNEAFVVPEVFVVKSGDEYVVTTNNDYVPHLRISNVYKDLLSQGETGPEVRDYIRERIRAGKFLIKSIHQRQDTITRIAQEIVQRQRDFMEHGIAQLKPMTMVQVAEVVGVHETTVSRAVSGKYMETPQGVFEMKFFFTSGVQTDSGVDMSNTSVKNSLLQLVEGEDKSKPLSDEELVARMRAAGIQIARRTIAKYRSELNILPSHLRKLY